MKALSTVTLFSVTLFFFPLIEQCMFLERISYYENALIKNG